MASGRDEAETIYYEPGFTAEGGIVKSMDGSFDMVFLSKVKFQKNLSNAAQQSTVAENDLQSIS